MATLLGVARIGSGTELDPFRPDLAGASLDPAQFDVAVRAERIAAGATVYDCEAFTRPSGTAPIYGSALDWARRMRFLEIDRKTVALIRRGFPHAGKTFSLSAEAQRYWTGAALFRDAFPVGTFPLRANTIDDGTTHDVLDAAEVFAAYGSAVTTVKAHLASGTALKDQVRAATTVAGVSAVVDGRT